MNVVGFWQLGILEFFPGAWLLVGLPWLGFLDGCITGWGSTCGTGGFDDGDDLFSFGKMEIGVSTCVITIVSATQFFFVNFLGELFRMHRKASSFSGNYLPEL